MISGCHIINSPERCCGVSSYLTRSAMLVANALVMSDPPALLPRWPKVSIHDLHLNFTLLPVICCTTTTVRHKLVTTRRGRRGMRTTAYLVKDLLGGVEQRVAHAFNHHHHQEHHLHAKKKRNTAHY
jgi:hypothetical protein